MLKEHQLEKDNFRILIKEDNIGHVEERLNNIRKVYGLCSECFEQRQPLLPLAMARPGEKLIIMEIRAGRRAQSRLTSLGLRPGDQIEIINNNNNGRLVIGHNNTRIAIGRGIAEKILAAIDHFN